MKGLLETPEMIAIFTRLRERMVDEQLAARGIRDPRVLEAFRRVPRHLFVAEGDRHNAYQDRPLPAGYDQTISQPFMAATMTQALEVRPGMRVLEVGTGTGYQAAILADLGAKVCTVERILPLTEAAEARVGELGYNVHFHLGDGTLGVPEEAPFDRILVTAGAPSLPVTLTSQLREDGGVMLIPVGDEGEQDLIRVVRDDGRVSRDRLCSCAFVKLVGREGW